MHTLKLLSAFFKVNVQMALAYRADTVVNILLNLMWLGWELLGLNIIFSNTETLGGWGLGELIALLGVFRLVNTMMIALIWPNTEKFNQSPSATVRWITPSCNPSTACSSSHSRASPSGGFGIWCSPSYFDRGGRQHVWRSDHRASYPDLYPARHLRHDHHL
jgi:hypothetical protein